MSPQTLFGAAATLIGILAFIGLAARSVKTRLPISQNRQGRSLVLLETVPVDPRRRLHLVRCGERQFVLLTGGTQDIVVGWVAGA